VYRRINNLREPETERFLIIWLDPGSRYLAGLVWTKIRLWWSTLRRVDRGCGQLRTSHFAVAHFPMVWQYLYARLSDFNDQSQVLAKQLAVKLGEGLRMSPAKTFLRGSAAETQLLRREKNGSELD